MKTLKKLLALLISSIAAFSAPACGSYDIVKNQENTENRYTEVLKEVDNKNRVYLTRNGHGAYTIMTVAEADELDRIRAARALAFDLKRAEECSYKTVSQAV